MVPLIHPTDGPREILADVDCLASFLAEAIPGWLAEPEMRPPSPEAVQGAALIASVLADMVQEAARRMPGREAA